MHRVSLLSAFLLASTASASAQETIAKYVIGLADTDMVGTAYEDGQLGAPLDAADSLIVFDPRSPAAPGGTVHASNSVFSPPTVMDVSPNGSRAVVVETLRARGEGDTTLADLEGRPGTTLRLFDLSDAAAPRLINAIEVPARPQAAQFNAAGDLVAVVGLPSSNGLTLVPVGPDGFGEARTFDLSLTERGDIPFDPAHNVQLHPSADIVAVPLTLRNQIAFYRVIRDEVGTPTGIEAWGNLVATNKFPIAGTFTPDGRHYITSDLMWGPDVQRFYGVVGQGTLTSIRLADPDAQEPRHEIQGVQTGGFQAESIAVSPDGGKIAISSMRTTGLPRESDLFDPEASVSLYAFDPDTGGMTLIEEERFEAMLPQGIAFDPSGDQLYVGVNEYFDATDPILRGGIEIWNVSNAGLTRTEVRMPAPRGIHVVEVVGE